MPYTPPSKISDVQTVYSVNNRHGQSYFEATLQVKTTSGKYRSIQVSCEEPIEAWDDIDQVLIHHVSSKYSNAHTNVPADQH